MEGAPAVTRRETIEKAILGAYTTLPEGLSQLEEVAYIADEVDQLLGLTENQPRPPAEQDGLDPAAIMVEHRGNEIEGCGPDLFCIECDDVEWPCLPYRLAALALDLQGKVCPVPCARCDGHRRG